MKITLIVFITFCLFIGKSATAQTEFAPLGAEWYYGSTGNFNKIHYSNLVVEKDTLINDISCRKIVGTYVRVNGDSSILDPLYVYDNKDTIFYYNVLFSKFTPLYIFNVKKGDTLTYYVSYYYYYPHYFEGPTPPPPPPPPDSLFKVKVDSIQTLNIAGQNLKRVWTSQANSGWRLRGSYTEKIGSTFLLVPNHPGAAIPEDVEVSLRCYKDSLISYQYTDYKCDYMYVGINEHNDHSKSISIHPNPSQGVFVLKRMVEGASEMTGILTDVSGRTVASLYIPYGLNEKVFKFQLPKGIYLLKIKSANGFYSQKLVIH